MRQNLTVSQSSLTADEAATLERVQTVTRLLDEAVRIPGTEVRIGLDPILSILPVAGDAAGAVLSLYPVVEAYRLGVPSRTLLLMLSLVAVDAVIGSVPILGTVFDALWKANQWNYGLMERQLDS
ncbi:MULTISPECIES: DUF4112 domain-containing protein [Haloarcula]|uniref:DUF4112 domain-containing protein n=1 Tax=Haloarcula TaxID=2237 RepID=UPI0023E816F1|nr:DUF4112 domain-containing protein [Halomicroarcula sp. SHR3]